MERTAMSNRASSAENFLSELTPRRLTSGEVGLLVKGFRQIRGWTQETLAELAGMSVKTVSRVESGQAAGIHTLRALGEALALEDADLFSKPQRLPTAKQLTEYEERLEAETVTVTFSVIQAGRDLRDLADRADMYVLQFRCDSAEVEAEFAALADLTRDYGDLSDEISQTEKLALNTDFEVAIKRLEQLDAVVLAGVRKIRTHPHDLDGGRVVSVLYLLCTPTSGNPGPRRVARDLD
jgi:transcriptional regulator with XRE-family HTH domain